MCQHSNRRFHVCKRQLRHIKRTDEYGGSIENRARFACEILDAVRAKVGENFVIEYRISADEFHPEQMHFPETLEFIGIIKDKVDILHVSAGIHDLWGEPYYMRFLLQNYTMDRMYNVHFAAKVKEAYPELIVATVGSIKDVAMAEEIIASGKADKVTVIDIAKEIDLTETGAVFDLLSLSQEHGIKRELGKKLVEIKEKTVLIEDVETGAQAELKADTVLFAVGLSPRTEEAIKFWHCCPESNFFIIGDCAEVGNVRSSVWTAFEAARYI